LTDLNRFGLNDLARNIQFTTEDGYLLKGYHLIPPHDALSLLTDNAESTNNNNTTLEKRINNTESFFDSKLANSNRIIIYFHGNAGTRAFGHRIEIAKKLSLYFSAHVISFDYRGFGDSEGFPSEYGTLLDGKAVMKWIEDIFQLYNSNENRPTIYFYGHSLGLYLNCRSKFSKNNNRYRH
jgi:pimeloyl-ACP methyl ester carboxylesterase